MLDQVQKLLATHKSEPQDLPAGAHTRAAIVAPLFEHNGELGIVLIKRSESIGIHRGQIGFPGGMVEPGDNQDLLQTALREAEEELGIIPSEITILGRLSDRHTVVSGILVSPFVGEIPFPYSFSPDPVEVESYHSIYLKSLLETREEALRSFDLPEPVYLLGNLPVWGLTARIIVELAAVLEPVLETGTRD
ncbi:CoA pyrophosphatase [bacterium]|nr:MAG: CoA pyrophosphatase [bacterium]